MQKISIIAKRLSRVLIFVILTAGCSNRVLLDESSLQKEQTVVITLTTGKKVSGTVASMNEKSIVVVDENLKAWRAQRNFIQSIHGPEPAYDINNRLISEKEIESVRTAVKRWRFTVSGALISLGTSFFASSMLSRATDEESREPIIYSGTAAGTALGTWLFYRIGAKKDRAAAIDRIREDRADRNLAEEILKEQKRKEKLKQEIDSLKVKMEVNR
jgi:hypothetical protein